MAFKIELLIIRLFQDAHDEILKELQNETSVNICYQYGFLLILFECHHNRNRLHHQL